MNTDRIEKIQKGTAHPESTSVAQALLQVWNECAQENEHKKCERCEALNDMNTILEAVIMEQPLVDLMRKLLKKGDSLEDVVVEICKRTLKKVGKK